MLPNPPLAPLDPHKTRALTTIYAPRKLKTRNRTAETRMLDKNVAIKPTLSPFHPLPAIGQKLERSKTKVLIFDLNKRDSNTALDDSIKVHEVLKPLTPITIHHFKRKNLMEQKTRKPQQLIRENTYDVIDPVYVNVGNMKETLRKETTLEPKLDNTKRETKVSPKTRFKKAAMQVAKLSSMPETGKLLCLRERQTYEICRVDEDKSSYKLQNLPPSPVHKLDKLSEIFQSLETNGRHRDKMKKENSWF